MAIFLRIALLFVVKGAIESFETPFLVIGQDPPEDNWIHCEFNLESTVVLLGGAFILYTAVKEIFHLLSMDDLEHQGDGSATRTVGAAVFWIVLMNLVFSFDSILSAMARLCRTWEEEGVYSI